LDGRSLTALVGIGVYAVFAAALWSHRRLSSTQPLDGWGALVLLRSERAIWMLWGVALIAHVGFWSMQVDLELSILIPIALLLGTRFERREASVWLIALTTLSVVSITLPTCFSTC